MVLYIKDGRKFFDGRLLSCIEMANSIGVQSIVKNVDVRNLVDGYGKTLVHYAAMSGDEITMKYLTRQGCQVNALDSFGYTPLMYAVKNGCSLVVSALLESNADILLCGQNQQSPLKMAFDPFCQASSYTALVEALKKMCSEDSQQMARILLDIKCSLIDAMRLTDPVITECMLDAGCNVNEYDSDGDWTPLHHAIENNDLDHVKLLLERGADIYAMDVEYVTPLGNYNCQRMNSYPVLLTLLNHDSSLQAFDIYDSDLVQHVFRHGQMNEIEALLNYYDLDFAAPRNHGGTLLHDIAINMNHDLLERVLKGKRLHVNARDSFGRTALWYAGIRRMSYNLSTIEFLLKHGADVNIVDPDGWTILYQLFADMQREEGMENDYMEFLELLLEYGADVQHEIPGSETIFHIALKANQFALIKPAIAQVAMIEASGHNIKEGILQILDGNERYKKFLILCRKKIKKLQNTMINESVRLFQFLIDSEEKLLMCARNHEAVAKLKKIVRRERRSKIFFVKRLRKRVENIVKIAKLREEAAFNLSRVTGIGHQDVIEKIILLLDKPSLQALGGI